MMWQALLILSTQGSRTGVARVTRGEERFEEQM